jgi:hypothetical protein
MWQAVRANLKLYNAITGKMQHGWRLKHDSLRYTDQSVYTQTAARRIANRKNDLERANPHKRT